LRQYFINIGCKTWFGTAADDGEPEKKTSVADDAAGSDDESSRKKRKVEVEDGEKKDTIYAKLVAPLRLPVKRMIRRN
jgi:hypothetical protein